MIAGLKYKMKQWIFTEQNKDKFRTVFYENGKNVLDESICILHFAWRHANSMSVFWITMKLRIGAIIYDKNKWELFYLIYPYSVTCKE